MVSKHRALCIGINQFKNYPESNLQGCVNDANDMAAICQKYWGFTGTDITVLTDAQATKAHIMKNLENMVADAKAGKIDHLLLSLSSHGTQVPDTGGDEPDRADEAFCPHDLAEKNGEWDRRFIITDDELHDLVVKLPQSALLEVFFDTCHSGSGLKAVDLLPGRRPRWLPPPSYEAFEKVRDSRPRGLARMLLERGLTHHILWAACRADQTSADARFGTTWHGAFTYFLVKEIKAANNQITRKALLEKVRNDLAAAHFGQVPQLETEASVRSLKLAA